MRMSFPYQIKLQKAASKVNASVPICAKLPIRSTIGFALQDGRMGDYSVNMVSTK